jgi:hypothetical protein
VTDIPLPASDTSSCDSTQDKGQPEENNQPILGVRVTGFYLLNTTLILVYGIWKAISSYRGQSVIPTTLELIFGTPVALMYVLIIQARAPREAEKVDPVQIIPRQSVGGTTPRDLPKFLPSRLGPFHSEWFTSCRRRVL